MEKIERTFRSKSDQLFEEFIENRYIIEKRRYDLIIKIIHQILNFLTKNHVTSFHIMESHNLVLYCDEDYVPNDSEIPNIEGLLIEEFHRDKRGETQSVYLKIIKFEEKYLVSITGFYTIYLK